LKEIGLTENEAKVYLTLLETGSTTAGVVVKKTHLHRSTTYEIIRRLQESGLISYVIKSGRRYFRATEPEAFLEVLKEREEKFKSILPALKMKKKISGIMQKAEIYEGERGIKSAFEYALNSVKKGDEAYVLGVSGYPDSGRRFFINFHKRRAAKGVKLKIIISEKARGTIGKDREGNPLTETKYVPENVITPPLNICIYSSKIIFNLWTEKNPVAFLVESKEIADSLKKYFDILWNRDTYTLRGYDGIVEMCEQVLRTGKDVYLIGANGGLPKLFPAFFGNFEKRRVEAGITRHHLAIEETRGTPFSKLKKLKVRYLPKEFSSPLVIWIFGDHVAQVLWDDQIVFMTKNKKVADDYRKYFKFLWKNAKL
jgi:sugar-specific transcriptional regulator TrmB